MRKERAVWCGVESGVCVGSEYIITNLGSAWKGGCPASMEYKIHPICLGGEQQCE